MIEDLSTINTLSPVVNSDKFLGRLSRTMFFLVFYLNVVWPHSDVDFLKSKLSFLEDQFEPIIAETRKQSQEIDELLELYEKAVSSCAYFHHPLIT
jgi:hypothetical protein